MGVNSWITGQVMLHLLLLLSAAVLAQDTHFCPDGWHISEIGDEVECLLLSGVDERVTKADAAVICQFHEGWLVDMDEGRGPQKNNLIKSLINDADPGSPGIPGNQYGDLRYLLSLMPLLEHPLSHKFLQPSQLTNTNWTDWINIFSRIDFCVENNIYIISKQLTCGK